MITAVAFDIDGTLYSNFGMYRATGLVVLRHVKLFRAFGDARQQVRREAPLEDLAERTVELTAENLGWSVARTRDAVRSVIYREWEQSLRSVPLYPGARDLVMWLRDQNIKTAAMSDFPTASKLTLLGLDGLWDVAFSSEETGCLKPHREPFDRLVSDLEVPASSLLYVGNSYDYDILGAHAAGLRTAHRAWRPRRESIADVTFAAFAELREWLKPRIAVANGGV